MNLLTVPYDVVGTVSVIRPSGQLDVLSYPTLRDALLKHAASGPDALIVDLAELDADRVTSLSVFPTVWLQISSWPDIPMALAAPGAQLAALLARSAVPRFVPVHDSVDTALAEIGRPVRRRRARTVQPALASTPRTTRDWVRATLQRWGWSAVEEVMLVVSELVSNAVMHTAASEVSVRLELRPGALSVAVHDPDLAPPKLSTGGTPFGGLGIVDAISQVWGHSPALSGGKIVWAVIRAGAAASSATSEVS